MCWWCCKPGATQTREHLFKVCTAYREDISMWRTGGGLCIVYSMYINELVLNRTSVNTNSNKPDVNPAPLLMSVATRLKNAKKTLDSTGLSTIGFDHHLN